MRKYGVPVVVAINRFDSDTDAELAYIEQYCKENGADFALSEVFAKGGEGGMELARKVFAAAEQPSNFHPIYAGDLPVREKIATIAKEIYGADGVTYTAQAEKALKEIAALGGDALPVCIAKTQYSLSDNAALLGRPAGFQIHHPGPAPLQRRGLRGRLCGGHHDDARPAEASCGGADRCGCIRKNIWFILR